jgi:hypothetical protein
LRSSIGVLSLGDHGYDHLIGVEIQAVNGAPVTMPDPESWMIG